MCLASVGTCVLSRNVSAKVQDFPLIQHDDLFGHSKVSWVGQIQEVVPRGVLSGKSQPENTPGREMRGDE